MANLKVLFVTQDDPFYIPHFFDEFIKHQGEDVDVQGVVIQSPLGKKTMSQLLKQMLSFYGPLDFLRIGIRFAFFAVMNGIAIGFFRGRLFGTFSLKHLLLKKGWNIIPSKNVNSTEFVAFVKSLNIDLVISVAASQIFKQEILRTPRYGCINVHNSRLPQNRGMLPNFWALYNSDREPRSAMTVHRMNSRLDDGEIILQKEFLLNPQESLHELIIRTKRMNAVLVLEALSLFADGVPRYASNDPNLATYNTFPTKEDVRKFKAKGLRLI